MWIKCKKESWIVYLKIRVNAEKFQMWFAKFHARDLTAKVYNIIANIIKCKKYTKYLDKIL